MKNMSEAVKKNVSALSRVPRSWEERRKERESCPKGGEIREEGREGREGLKKRRKVGSNKRGGGKRREGGKPFWS